MKKVAILSDEQTFGSQCVITIAQIALSVPDWMPIYAEAVATISNDIKDNIFKIIYECDAVIIDDTNLSFAIKCKSYMNLVHKQQKPYIAILSNDLRQGSMFLAEKIRNFLNNLAL